MGCDSQGKGTVPFSLRENRDSPHPGAENRDGSHPGARKSAGFTLLEVILALLLTSLVLMAVGTAIDIHLRLVDSSRTGVEEAQLARALLDRIADDLRGAVLYNPIDTDELLEGVPTSWGSSGAADGGASPSGGGGGASPSGGEGGSSPGTAGAGTAATEGSDESEDSEADSTTEADESTQLESDPGLVGQSYWLRVDTSRLPRVDELEGMVLAGSSTETRAPSDVKTVIYVVGDSLSGTAYASGLSQNGTGLVRLEYDRAVAVWVDQQGQLAEMLQNAEPVAPEVAAIEFRYFDGTELVEEWDSTARGGLPVAVEVAVGIIPARLRESRSSSAGTTTAAALGEEDLLIYRRLVHLPAAQPTTAGDTSETWESPSEESSDESRESAGEASTGGSPLGGESAR